MITVKEARNMNHALDAIVPTINVNVTCDVHVPYNQRVKVIRSAQTADIVRQMFEYNTICWTESFYLLCLDRSSSLKGIYQVSSGGIHATTVDIKVIATVALGCAATSVIVAHNHPSGNLKPSSQDIAITNRIKEALKYLDIQLLDHIIVSDESFYSFLEDGQL